MVFGCSIAVLGTACAVHWRRVRRGGPASPANEKIEMALWLAVGVAAIYTVVVLPDDVAIAVTGLLSVVSFLAYRILRRFGRAEPLMAFFLDLLLGCAAVAPLLTILAVLLYFGVWT